MGILLKLISLGIDIYTFIIIVQVALSWLVAFEIVNSSNEAARNLMALLKRATDPVYSRLRKYIPPIGGIDLTPLVVIVGLGILEWMLYSIFLG